MDDVILRIIVLVLFGVVLLTAMLQEYGEG